MRICTQAETDAVEYVWESAPREYEDLLAPKDAPAEGDGDAEGSGHMGLGAGASSGGGLGFVSAEDSTPGLGSAGRGSPARAYACWHCGKCLMPSRAVFLPKKALERFISAPPLCCC